MDLKAALLLFYSPMFALKIITFGAAIFGNRAISVVAQTAPVPSACPNMRPMDFYFAVDISGSAIPNIKFIKDFTKNFARAVFGSTTGGNRMRVSAFSNKTWGDSHPLVSTQGALDSQVDAVVHINHKNYASNVWTNIALALDKVKEALGLPGADPTKSVVVFLSDGFQNEEFDEIKTASAAKNELVAKYPKTRIAVIAIPGYHTQILYDPKLRQEEYEKLSKLKDITTSDKYYFYRDDGAASLKDSLVKYLCEQFDCIMTTTLRCALDCKEESVTAERNNTGAVCGNDTAKIVQTNKICDHSECHFHPGACPPFKYVIIQCNESFVDENLMDNVPDWCVGSITKVCPSVCEGVSRNDKVQLEEHCQNPAVFCECIFPNPDGALACQEVKTFPDPSRVDKKLYPECAACFKDHKFGHKGCLEYDQELGTVLRPDDPNAAKKGSENDNDEEGSTTWWIFLLVIAFVVVIVLTIAVVVVATRKKPQPKKKEADEQMAPMEVKDKDRALAPGKSLLDEPLTMGTKTSNISKTTMSGMKSMANKPGGKSMTKIKSKLGGNSMAKKPGDKSVAKTSMSKIKGTKSLANKSVGKSMAKKPSDVPKSKVKSKTKAKIPKGVSKVKAKAPAAAKTKK